MPTTPATEVAVTNASGVDVTLLLYNQGMDPVPGTLDVPGNVGLEVFPTSTGSRTIRNGTTATLSLTRTFTDPTSHERTPWQSYAFLVCSAATLVPVGTLTIGKSDSAPFAWIDATVSSDGVVAMNQANVFYQTVQAFPNSQLATQYQKAMQNAQQAAQSLTDGSGLGTAIDTTINAWFAGTKAYGKVTLECVTAIETYYSVFPFVFGPSQKDASSKTYYVYVSSTDATSGTSRTDFCGTLVVTPGTVDATLPNGGYSAAFFEASDGTGAKNTTVGTQSTALTYQDALFSEDPDNLTPNIALKGIFATTAKMTGTPAATDKDASDVKLFLTGSYRSSLAFGLDTAIVKTDAPDSIWETLFHPKTSGDWFRCIMEWGGILMMAHFVGSNLLAAGRWIKGKLSPPDEGTKPITKADLDAKVQELQASNKKLLQEQFEKMNRGAPEEESLSEEDVAEGGRLGASVDGVSAEASATRMDNSLEGFKGNMEDLAEMAPDMSTEALSSFKNASQSFEAASAKLATAREGLADGSLSQTEFNSSVDEGKADFSKFSSEFDTMNNTVKESVDADLEAELQETDASIGLAEDVETQLEEEDEADEDGAELEGEGIEEMPVD